MANGLKSTLRSLYLGDSQRSVRFRYGLILFDLFTILYFIGTAPFDPTPLTRIVSAVIAVLILLDLAARLTIAANPWRLLRRVYVIADLIVIGSMLVDPFFNVDLTFLRLLRGLRLVDSFHLLRDLRRDSGFFRKREDLIVAVINFFVFLFLTTSVVFTFFGPPERGVAVYIDALYFTVATLTTTGFGDITPTTPGAKLITVLIMIVGVSLFLRLARVIVLPAKVRYTCKTCGLSRHEPDAVHCKHCGAHVTIATSGMS